MIKKLVTLGIAILLLFSMVSLTACNPPEEDEDMGLKAGFNGGDEAAPYACAYVSDKKEFDIDDVTLSFSFRYIGCPSYRFNGFPGDLYFQVHFIETSLYPGEWVNTTPEAEYPTWVFVRDLDNWHLIKEILLDEFNFGDYANLATNSEELTIPKGLFVKQQGCIVFSVQEYYVWDDGSDPRYSNSGGINIYYKVVGEKVILSTTDFQ